MSKRILLIGDGIIDVYVYGAVVGQALDAPVPEVEERETKVFFGGNGLVAENILELGGGLTYLSVVGQDEDAKYYNTFKHRRLKKIFLIDKTRVTTVKRRWYAGGRKLLQVNKVDNHDVGRAHEMKVLNQVERNIKGVDVVVVMDPQHGLLTKRVIKGIISLTKKYQKPLFVDAQISHRDSNHHLYKGAHTMFLNQKEARAVYPKFSLGRLEESLWKIKNKFGLQDVIIKLGDRGVVALLNGKIVKEKTFKVKTLDPCGAGDAFLAAYSSYSAKNAKESLRVANIWAALSTTIHGTRPPKKGDLLKNL